MNRPITVQVLCANIMISWANKHVTDGLTMKLTEAFVWLMLSIITIKTESAVGKNN